MVLFIPLGAKVFAWSMMYCSLALRTLSRMSRNCSSGNICMSSRVCPVRFKCSATPDLSVRFCMMSVSYSSNVLADSRVAGGASFALHNIS